MRSAYLKDDGARVYEDGNYLVTGGWVLSRSGETKRINISWESLFEIDKKERIYELFVQKQPNIEYLLNLEIIYPSGIEGQKNRIVRSYKIDSDRLIELKIE